MTPAIETPRRPFDQAAATRAREFAAVLFLAHPELRGIAISFDWRDNLNDATLHGVWLSDNGVVSAPAGVFGAIQQTVRMLETQVSRAVELHQHLVERVQALATEAARRHEEVKRLEEEIEARRATIGRDSKQEAKGQAP